MRFAWLFVVLAGCGAGRAEGPQWPKGPKAAVGEADGGESLAPRTASAAVVASSDDDDDALDLKLLTPVVVKPATAATPATPTTTPGTTTAPGDDPIMTEDLIIEIDD
jgi:hypothetical protein